MSDGNETVVDLDAMGSLAADLIDTGERLRTEVAQPLSAIADDPLAPSRSYGADARNSPAQSIAATYDAAVASAELFTGNVAVTIQTFGRAAERLVADAGRTDGEAGYDIDTTADDVPDVRS